MRHKIAHRKLNRTSEHRKALFKNMLNSLIKHEQIKTTLPKAKELKPLIDKVITIGKKKDLSARRSLISKLQDEDSAEKLITVLSKRVLFINCFIWCLWNFSKIFSYTNYSKNFSNYLSNWNSHSKFIRLFFNWFSFRNIRYKVFNN